MTTPNRSPGPLPCPACETFLAGHDSSHRSFLDGWRRCRDDREPVARPRRCGRATSREAFCRHGRFCRTAHRRPARGAVRCQRPLAHRAAARRPHTCAARPVTQRDGARAVADDRDDRNAIYDRRPPTTPAAVGGHGRGHTPSNRFRNSVRTTKPWSSPRRACQRRGHRHAALARSRGTH
jgi:hypothetical protein